jgi:hypothetical protein
VLDIYEHIARRLCAADQFVELELDGFAVVILAVNKKDGEERRQCRTGVDDELPTFVILPTIRHRSLHEAFVQKVPGNAESDG